MKILYELVITEDTGFTASDFPDRFETLRKGKTPLVFKPVAISTQEMYSRLNEAEDLLKEANIFIFNCPPSILGAELTKRNNHYFERHAQ